MRRFPRIALLEIARIKAGAPLEPSIEEGQIRETESAGDFLDTAGGFHQHFTGGFITACVQGFAGDVTAMGFGDSVERSFGGFNQGCRKRLVERE